MDPGFLRPGLDLATSLILELCGGEASEVVVAGAPLEAPAPILFDPNRVRGLSGIPLEHDGVAEILRRLGFGVEPRGVHLNVTPPTFRRDVEGSADLVEEVARIAGFDKIPSTPLPETPYRHGGVLTSKQSRVRIARRALAALGYQETIGWSFVSDVEAALFGGGAEALRLVNPIAADLGVMRPSALPGLIAAALRNRARGLGDLALFEIGPVFQGDRPEDQKTVIAGLLAPDPPRRWDGAAADPLFALKGDVFELLAELGAPLPALQITQTGLGSWWSPGRSARLQLGPKTAVGAFGALHPKALRALGADETLLGFEIILETLPEPRRRSGKARPRLVLSPMMPLTRDFAFVVAKDRPAGDLVRAASGADRELIAEARVFDVYEGAGVGEGEKSIALEVVLQPAVKTLTDAEIDAVSKKIIAAVGSACGARLRGAAEP